MADESGEVTKKKRRTKAEIAEAKKAEEERIIACLLYTSDAADE